MENSPACSYDAYCGLHGGSTVIGSPYYAELDILWIRMPVLQYRGTGLGRNIYPSVAESGILYNCSCEIQVDTERITSGFGSIVGTLKACVTDNVRIKSIWVELEGTSTTQFQSKVDDGRVTSHLKRSQFLPFETNPGGVSRVFLIGDDATTSPTRSSTTLSPGDYIYPFDLKLNYDTLPTSMITSFGWINYNVTVYVISLVSLEFQSYWSKKAAAKSIIKCNGFAALPPSLLSPLELTLKKEKYFFTKRISSKMDITLEQKGYICGEEIKGEVRLENAAEDFIPEIVVSLCQRMTYYSSYSCKSTVCVLNERKFKVSTNESEIRVSLRMQLPRKLMPSFTDGKKSIEIVHFVQVEATRNSKHKLKGEAKIVIGSTWKMDGEEGERQPRVDSRRLSVVSSNFDTISIQSGSTLPPTYSSLASRRHSLETLPPLYDDVICDYSSSAAVTPTHEASP
ncbi:unnamed protein product [Allacma fusca]|uniref:Arrestin C-terminal-like domain-containing protein n=1 Tax=Allacma fusca TaxID=39272 RepID=A0A8J2JZM8_9HEXA|nr:unnamed protein product [Allacma fusca]